MPESALSSVQGPLKQQYRDHPDAAVQNGAVGKVLIGVAEGEEAGSG